jgi:hypothetical protein
VEVGASRQRAVDQYLPGMEPMCQMELRGCDGRLGRTRPRNSLS